MEAKTLCETCGHYEKDHAAGGCRGRVYWRGKCACKKPVYIVVETRAELSRIHKRALDERERQLESTRGKDGVYDWSGDKFAAVLNASEKELYLWSIVCEAMRDPPD